MLKATGMEEIESYYDKKSESYDEIFSTLYFKVYDAITWKYLEPHVPTDDVVEIAPNYDQGTSAINAAKVIFEMLCQIEKAR